MTSTLLATDAPHAGCVPLTAAERHQLGAFFAGSKKFARPEYALPPISPLALRLIDFDPEAPRAAAELVAIVESDPALTARMLGLSNAAAFVPSGKLIYEVRTAVMRLGINTTSRVALAQLAGSWMRRAARLPTPEQLRPLWLEYLITAFSAYQFAWLLGDDAVHPAIAYTAGLLHDIGTIALLGAEPVLMTRFMQARLPAEDPLYERYVEAHSLLGAALLERWRAPTLLAEVAERHHAGASADESIGAVVVYLADQFHDRVLARIPGRFGLSEDERIGCSADDEKAVMAAAAALDLDQQIDLVTENVAEESGRIEALARDLS